jgi:hypothetical protein
MIANVPTVLEVEPAAAADVGGQPSFECKFGASPWLADLKSALGLRRVIDPRTSALLLQPSMGLRPGWRFVGILNPMGHRCLITPFRQLRHNPAMHARLHKGAHGRFVAPQCAGPESTIGIAEDRNRKAPSRSLGLARCTKGLDQEPRHVSPGPNAEPCDAHEGHQEGCGRVTSVGCAI